MIRETLALLLLLLGAPVSALPAATILAPARPEPATQDGARAAVDQVLERAEALPLERAWPLANDLAGLGAGKPQLDALRAASAEGSPRARLIVARAFLAIDREYSEEAASILVDLLQGTGPESTPAAVLLQSRLIALPDEVATAKISKRLEDLVVAGGLSTSTRLATAVALWRLGSSDQRSVARREILTFYRSEDPEIRYEGALALASIDDVEQARPLLKDLADEPSERGRLARAYLEREDDANLWRARIQKIQQIHAEGTKESRGTVDPGDPRVLNDVLDLIRERHTQGDQWMREELVAAAARGMLNALDPHSTYLSAAEYAKMLQELKQVYAGIGAQVRTIRGAFTIIRPFFSGPAYKAGLRAGDQVVSIVTDEPGGKTAEWMTSGQEEGEIIKRLKGQPGTSIALKVMRHGWIEPRAIPITRAEIEIPLVESELLPGGIGYLDLQQFGEEVTAALIAQYRAMDRTGQLKALVLDLRNNPGGFLESARDVVELFLPKGSRVCYTEGRQFGRNELFTRRNPLIPADMPVAVLVNDYSASASEITAGALQDYSRAIVVGEHTYGKGSVQRLFEIPSLPDEEFTDSTRNGLHDEHEPFKDRNGNGVFDAGPRVKLTVERWYLPGGRSINTEWDREQRKVVPGGIQPDRASPWPAPDLAKAAEIDRVLNDSAVADYVRDHFDAHRALFHQLAIEDGKDPSRYPEFDALYTKLATSLQKNDVRRIVRWRLRDRIAEDRGKMFPGYAYTGDVNEDPQLRDAIEALLQKLGTSFEAVPEYAAILEQERKIGIDLGPRKESAGPRTADSSPPDTTKPQAR